MAQYYYTVASLPTVQLEQEPPITIEYFLDACSYTIKEKDFHILQMATILPEGKPSHPAIASWYAWEMTLRNELVKMRALNTGFDAAQYLREGDNVSGPFDAAREAVSSANPALGEDVLDRARWRYLEEMQMGHIFDMTALIVYYLKLQIAQRRKVMTVEKGTRIYKDLYNRITAKIHQSNDGEL
ncbi:MAG: DUF2764 family protein [Spirochaetales bacterium]|nr:DUF2764 family protein [Spirochaetales bacterium]